MIHFGTQVAKVACMSFLLISSQLSAHENHDHTQQVGPSKTFSTTAKKLRAAIHGVHRAKENKARDRYRHPYQTLKFFGLRHDMRVIEVSPGAGWYTEILAPVLMNKGEYIAAHFTKDSSVPYYARSYKNFNHKISSFPDVYEKVRLATFEPPQYVDLGAKNSADMVLTFRNTHNWAGRGIEREAFQAMYDALKPGGVLGVVAHRAPDEANDNFTKLLVDAKNGYLPEDYVINLVESIGFELVASSEVNANTKDMANHPSGVWSLPPSLKEHNKNRDYYLSIGESDRMTLKFIKPRS